jgi:superfamily II DNA or RNA helicase
MAAIYRDLTANDNRTRQITADVAAALDRGLHCLVLTQWVAHLDALATALQAIGHDPVVLRGGMTARARAAALARLEPQPGGPPLLVVATGPYAGEGFDCPALDTLFLAAPIRWKGRLVQYAGRILRPFPGKDTAEVHDYHDAATGVLAATLAGRAPGYTSLGFPDPAESRRPRPRARQAARGRRPGKAMADARMRHAASRGAFSIVHTTPEHMLRECRKSSTLDTLVLRISDGGCRHGPDG